MKAFLHVVASLLLLFTATLCVGGSAGTSPSPVSLCDLVKNPAAYTGKMVAVKGEVGWGWLHGNKPVREFGITQPFSSTECVAELTVMLPDAVQPKTFDVEKDEHFEKLEEGLHKGMRIEGTFEGRFEQSQRTYGQKHKAKMRLVLQKVSSIFAMPVSRPR